MDNIDLEMMDIFKALSNETRLRILKLLKDPEANFGDENIKYPEAKPSEVGVCVGQITEKIDMNQSTMSQYLSIMARAGILIPTRIGKWTYYRRNEEKLQQISKYLSNEV
ncbi:MULTISPECIES: ArsR/SmtB family transcription factor [Bacillales]|uniref:ArsR/SmtB family transcription factor n=1 Tax=Bacillales TaxID=1385 RepID=UPI0002887D54|nr:MULTISPECIES: metalloregulator ArsR/SmtB family transcription factor [Bacillales]MED3572788.1 metalloregulator ArsR/SmtB family transcription factor [Cytobacillus praedii]